MSFGFAIAYHTAHTGLRVCECGSRVPVAYGCGSYFYVVPVYGVACWWFFGGNAPTNTFCTALWQLWWQKSSSVAVASLRLKLHSFGRFRFLELDTERGENQLYSNHFRSSFLFQYFARISWKRHLTSSVVQTSCRLRFLFREAFIKSTWLQLVVTDV